MKGVVLTVVTLVLVAGEALAAGGGHGEAHGINWFEIASMIFNFVLLFGFLAYRLSPTVRDALVTRRKRFAERLEEAQRKQAEAEARLEEYRKKVENLEDEFKSVIAGYEAQALNDRKRIEAEAAKAVERLAREADFTVQQEVRKAERHLRNLVVEATLKQAEELVRSSITDDDRRRLNSEYADQVRANGSTQ